MRANRCGIKTGINIAGARVSKVVVRGRVEAQGRGPAMPVVPMVPTGVTVRARGHARGRVPLRAQGMVLVPMAPAEAMVRGGQRAEATAARVATLGAMAPTAVVRAAAGTADGGSGSAE